LSPSLDLAIALHQQGDLDEAHRLYRALLAKDPHQPDALGLLGVVASQRGQHEEATDLLRRAASEAPTSVVIQTNLARALAAAGNSSDAIAAYRVALDLAPDAVETRFRLGTLLLEQGEAHEATDHLGRAAAENRGDTSTWQNLAAAQYRTGAYAAAEESYAQLLALEPGHAAALHGLGQVKRATGDTEGAIGVLWSAIRSDRDNPESWSAFAEAFGAAVFGDDFDVEAAERILEACFQHEAVDPERLAGQTCRVFRRASGIGSLIQQADDDPMSLQQAFKVPETWEQLTRPALLLALRSMILPDLGVERVLMAARRALGQRLLGDEALTEGQRDLLHALAHHCHFNGYLWSYGPEEVEVVESLVAGMADRPLGAAPLDSDKVQLLACYVPLSEWDRVGDVVALAQSSGSTELLDILIRQVLGPIEEAELSAEFDGSETEEGVTAAVRRLYEEHPYPRWERSGYRAPRPLATVLGELSAVQLPCTAPDPEHPEVLVAGCGTGKHLFEVRGRYAGARITGIDLSRASLGFAARKLRDAGVNDVSLRRVDLLTLRSEEDQYDVVESVGVLHHLEEPLAGWRVLTQCLRPGGLMRIGLYSAVARRAIDEARAAIDFEMPQDPEGLRAAREHLIASAGSGGTTLAHWRDFYSLHEFRDLVFHPQEHRFTLPELQGALSSLGLEFLGFDMSSPDVTARFREENPSDEAMCDLGAWARFEADHPTAFSGMYIFWARKPEL